MPIGLCSWCSARRVNTGRNRVLSHFGATLVHFLGPQKQEKPPLRVFRRGFAKIMAERTRFRCAALAASRCRPRGSGQPCNSPRPDGRSGRFGIRRPRASSRPPHTKTARRYKRWAVAGCGEDENRKSCPVPSRKLWKAFIINAIF